MNDLESSFDIYLSVSRLIMWNPRVRRMQSLRWHDEEKVYNPKSLKDIALSIVKTEAYVSRTLRDSEFYKILVRIPELEIWRKPIAMAFYNEDYLLKTRPRWTKIDKNGTLPFQYLLKYIDPEWSDSFSDSDQGSDHFEVSYISSSSSSEDENEKEPIQGNLAFKKMPHP